MKPIRDEHMHRLLAILEREQPGRGETYARMEIPAPLLEAMARELLEQRKTIAGLRAGVEPSLS